MAWLLGERLSAVSAMREVAAALDRIETLTAKTRHRDAESGCEAGDMPGAVEEEGVRRLVAN
jgi:hypothetical protein